VAVLETPGHTPESVCWLVYDSAGDPAKPHAILTGDTLFIGDVGRPDLMLSVGVSAEELAGQLYDSIHSKILPLPDDTLIYPGHGAGSMCGKNLSAETVSTLGVERRLNPSLAPMTREEFVRMVREDQPTAPAYFALDAVLNRRNRETLEDSLARALVPLALERVLEHRDQGAQLLDTRDPDDFARGHVPGSLNIGLEGTYATWAGTLLDRERPVVILADPGREQESALRLGRIGFDQVVGYLAGGPAALGSEHLRPVPRVEARELAARLRAPAPPVVLDVRNPREREMKQLAGSLSIPLDQLPARLHEVPRGPALVVHCAAGYRSSMAASLLRREGFPEVTDLVGGIGAWESAGMPVALPAGQTS
jgi:rhodanese-related sulfurtransferase